MSRFAFIVAVSIAGTIILPGGSLAAQGGTPAAGTQTTASCTDVTPRDAQFFQSLATPAAATPPGNTSASGATPAPFAMPEGEPADDATITELTTLYQQLVDCLNQGDYLRAYALYSDDYLLRNLSQDQIAGMAATPVAAEESQRVSFGGVLDARMLEDGRVGALVTTHSEQAGDLIVFTIVRREGDQLLIDDEQVVEAEIQATPAA
jgi:hypothetical protein